MIELLLLVFIASQVVYAAINLVGLVTIHPYRTRLVKKSEPEEYDDLHVLVPLREEPREVLEETLESIYDADYPRELTHVYAIYESDDEVVKGYIDELDLNTVPVDTDDALWQQITRSPTARTPVKKRKGRALTYALYKLNLDGVVTVLDADTKFDPDLFRRGVAGLDDYDITQSKQTVRNIDDGLLPLWESMGIAGWSHAIYAKTARGPYQLLGKGYFLHTDTLYDLRGWNPTDPTEDMALGIEAYTKGYKLGIIDSYVQDLCPPRFWDWVRQKRRWVGGPYRGLKNSTLSLRESLRFGSFTGVNQLMSINHLFGIPAGIAILYLVLTGATIATSALVTAVLVLNLVMWVYFTIRTYQATRRAVTFRSSGQKVYYYIVSNPITQVFYALLWVVPILLYVFGRRSSRDEFIVTPKQVRKRLGVIGNRREDGQGGVDASRSEGQHGSVFEVYRDKASEWRWRLIHPSHDIIADSGEGYARKAGVLTGLASVRRTVADAPVQNLEKGDEKARKIVGSDGSAFEVYRDTELEWRWRLIHHNGNIIADSGEGQEEFEDIESELDRVKQTAPDGFIVQLADEPTENVGAAEGDVPDGLTRPETVETR